MSFTQDDRLLKIETVLPKDTLLLVSVDAQEAISRPFSYKVEMLCEDLGLDIDPAQMIGSSVGIGIQGPPDSSYRYRSGFIRSFQAGNIRNNFRVFRAEVVPFLSFLDLDSDFRIFQNMTVVDILTQVFQEFGLNDLDMRRVKSSDYPKLEYCVQCRETAFDFVSRLMEENGIFYYFNHSEVGHTLVLGDGVEDYMTAEETGVTLSRETSVGKISSFEHGFDYRTGKWILGDFSYDDPAKPIFDQEPTRSTIPATNTYARYRFPEKFVDAADARRLVVARMQEEEASIQVISGTSQFRTWAPGFLFKIGGTESIPYSEGQTTYLVTSLHWAAFEQSYRHRFGDVLVGWLSGLWTPDSTKALGLGATGNAAQNTTNSMFASSPTLWQNLISGGIAGALALIPQAIFNLFAEAFTKTGDYNNQFMAIPGALLFRPPLTTVKPEIRGPHTALVVGSSGLATPGGNDTCTDDDGRVRVKFPWDRSTEHDNDGATTCLIRVAEGWAGDKWGTQFPPRVGQEVIVQFIDGDPDRPIITGRVYNGVSKEPLSPKTQSGIKTQSTPTPDGQSAGFHLLRLDDNFGKEQYLIRSQARLDVTALASYYNTTYGDRHILVKKSKKDGSGGDAYMATDKDYGLHVGGDRLEKMDKTYQLHVASDTTFALDGAHTTVVAQESSLNAATVVIEASEQISLSVGGNFVVISAVGVAINGTMVQINSGGSASSAASATTTDPTDPTAADPGEPPDWLARQGAETDMGDKPQHTAEAKRAPIVSTAPDGMLQTGPDNSVQIDPSDPQYAQAVVKDLQTIAQTPEGQQVLKDLAATGKPVTIRKPPAATDPPNAWTQPHDSEAASTPGKGTPSTIHYDPKDFPPSSDPKALTSPKVLQSLAQHAVRNATGQQPPNLPGGLPPDLDP